MPPRASRARKPLPGPRKIPHRSMAGVIEDWTDSGSREVTSSFWRDSRMRPGRYPSISAFFYLDTTQVINLSITGQTKIQSSAVWANNIIVNNVRKRMKMLYRPPIYPRTKRQQAEREARRQAHIGAMATYREAVAQWEEEGKEGKRPRKPKWPRESKEVRENRLRRRGIITDRKTGEKLEPQAGTGYAWWSGAYKDSWRVKTHMKAKHVSEKILYIDPRAKNYINKQDRVVDYAGLIEYGTEHIKARPILSRAINDTRYESQRQIEKMFAIEFSKRWGLGSSSAARMAGDRDAPFLSKNYPAKGEPMEAPTWGRYR